MLAVEAWLVGGIPTPLKNINGKDYPMHHGKQKNVWNHQPDKNVGSNQQNQGTTKYLDEPKWPML